MFILSWVFYSRRSNKQPIESPTTEILSIDGVGWLWKCWCNSWLVKWLADFASGRVVETYGGPNMFDPTAHVYCLYIAPYSGYRIRFRRYLHSWFIVCKCVNVCIHMYMYIYISFCKYRYLCIYVCILYRIKPLGSLETGGLCPSSGLWVGWGGVITFNGAMKPRDVFNKVLWHWEKVWSAD